MNRPLALAAALALFAGTAASQDIQVQAQNHLEASRDTRIESSDGKDIIEDWFDLGLYGENYLLGVRYSSFSPPDPVVSPDGKPSEGISHRFAELELGKTRIRAGTFTILIGRGLVFRSFENRDLRVDSNLDGLFIEHVAEKWQGTLFTGRAEPAQMEASERVRKDRFTGASGDLNLGGFRTGASFLTMQELDVNGHFTAERPEVHGLRAGLDAGRLRLDWEGARHLIPADAGQGKEGYQGRGHVMEGSLYLGPFDLYAGYKRYRDMAIYAGGKLMNQPPVLIHDPRATLVRRHPHLIDPNDEEGILADLAVRTPLGSFLVSHANTEHVKHEGVGVNSFRETFAEWDRDDWLGLASAHVLLDLQQAPNKYRPSVMDYFFSTASDVHLDRPWGGIVLGWEHQHVNSDIVGQYDDEFLTLEYVSRGTWSASLLGEYATWSEEQHHIHETGDINQPLSSDQSYRQFWGGAQLAAQIGEHHNLRLFAGSRREGYICVGGVCRFEPAFDGVELSLISTF